MAPTPKPIETPRVACEICLKEIPQSEAVSAEARDYVAHFCGIGCYRVWAERSADRNTAGSEQTQRRQP